jgi:3-deoxy-manno-octulosonate cytidylyltransferase (CMP-KDO synthetase)
MGLYVFNRELLELFNLLKPGEVEKAESVEMLRFIENGYDVKMIEVEDEGLSVDTIEDLKRVEEHINAYQ